MMRVGWLISRSLQPGPWQEALAAGLPVLLRGGPVTALAYTPDRCSLLRVGQDGALEGPHGPDPLPGLYELRAFSSSAELRWWLGPDGHGQTVLLEDGTGDAPEGATQVEEALEGSYFLWGTVQDVNGPWSGLGEARLPHRLWVPVAARRSQRIQLRFREFVLRYDDGNLAVGEERLLGLQVEREEEA
ncbi:MAG: CRISPR-associated protein Csx19 [Firmicutes bacterium]|nr:CRISPR-associated protein Csx19 [Bacillota bacterium]